MLAPAYEAAFQREEPQLLLTDDVNGLAKRCGCLGGDHKNWRDPAIPQPTAAEALANNSAHRNLPPVQAIPYRSHRGLIASRRKPGNVVNVHTANNGDNKVAGIAPEGTYNGTSQRVLFGLDSSKQLKEAILSLPAERVLVIAGRSVRSTPFVEIAHHLEPKITVRWHPGVQRHAPMSTISDGVTSVFENRIDALVAIGGGSAIDTAKGIALVHKHLSANMQDSSHQDPEVLPIVAVPTTLSQAEFTWVTGITDEATREKTIVQDPRLLPSIVILDGSVTTYTPHALWNSSAIKALDTTFSSLLLHNEEQPFWDPLLFGACRQLYLELADHSPCKGAVKRQRQQIAAWKGAFPKYHLPVDRSLTQNEAWIGSALRHQIGGLSGKPHGAIAGILLAGTLKFHLPQTKQKQTRIAKHLGFDGPDEMHAALYSLVSGLGLPTRLQDLGMSKVDLRHIVDCAVRELPSYKGRESEVVQLLQAVH